MLLIKKNKKQGANCFMYNMSAAADDTIKNQNALCCCFVSIVCMCVCVYPSAKI